MTKDCRDRSTFLRSLNPRKRVSLEKRIFPSLKLLLKQFSMEMWPKALGLYEISIFILSVLGAGLFLALPKGFTAEKIAVHRPGLKWPGSSSPAGLEVGGFVSVFCRGGLDSRVREFLASYTLASTDSILIVLGDEA